MKNEGGPHMEMARSFSPLTRLISYASSIMHVLLTVFFGYLISLRLIINLNPLVFVFAVISKLFAMMFAEHRNAPRKTIIYSTVALALLIPILTQLSSFEIIMGVLILMLYFLYPIVNGRAPFDVIHHALRYIFIFLLGYGSQAFCNETAVLAILAIALFSLAGELVAGLGKIRDSGKDAASLLGFKRSLIAIVSLGFIASLISSLVLNDLFEFPIQINKTFIPFYIVPALAFDLFLTMPLMRALNKKQVDVFHLMRRNEVMAMVIAALLILVLFQTARMATVLAVSTRDYSFDVGIRTFIAGAHSWDVPWIVFDYVNTDNYYYVVFHTDGILELSQRMDGQNRIESSLKTELTPFQWNDFHIILNETTVAVTLDGEYQVSTTRYLVANTFSIMISPSRRDWIASTYHISINP
jgi:hypothetical protein